MRAILSILFLASVLTVTAQAKTKSACYTGYFSVGGDKVKLKYTIKNNMLHVDVLNPDEMITLSTGESKLVKDLFDPGPDMKLIALEGVRCPCTALQTEKGNFSYIVEQKGDRSERAMMDYFGLSSGPVEVQRCER